MPLISLTPDQIRRLQAALLAAFPASPDLDFMLARSNRTYSQYEVPRENYRQILFGIINAAINDNWIVQLVSDAVADRPGDPDLAGIKSELAPAAMVIAVDPFEVCRLMGGNIMVNRARLRDALRVIHSPLGKRILVVSGKDKTGKSHSLQLIVYIKVVQKTFHLVSIDLEQYTRLMGKNTLVNAYDLATQIVSGLGYQFNVAAAPSDGQWARWTIEFYKDFAPLAANDPQTRWIVIDALNSVPLAQSGNDFIRELVLRVNLDLVQFRLILLGYKDSLPAAVVAHLEEEKIGAMCERDLVEFISKACVELDVPLSADKVRLAVQNILNGLDLTAEDFLLRLPQAANTELKRIKP